MVVGDFDYAVIALLIVFNLVFLNKKTKFGFGCLGTVLLLGIIFPSISMDIETTKVLATWKEGEIHDNFELFYTFLVFGLYWKIGALQILFLALKNVFLDEITEYIKRQERTLETKLQDDEL